MGHAQCGASFNSVSTNLATCRAVSSITKTKAPSLPNLLLLPPAPIPERRPFPHHLPPNLETLRQRHQFFLFGYVLIPEHVHLLVTEPKLQSLATILSVLKRETSKLLKANRPQFWQTRYYDFNVLTHAKPIEKLPYIHRNPVKRG